MKKKLEIEMEWCLDDVTPNKGFLGDLSVYKMWNKELYKFLGSKPCKVKVTFVKEGK